MSDGTRAPERSQLLAVATAFLRLRPWIVGPMMGLTLALMTAAGAPLAQRGALAVGMTLGLSFFVWEAVRLRTTTVTERWLRTSLTVTVAAIAGASAASGGLASPLVPMLFAPVVVAFAAHGRSAAGLTPLGVAAVALVALALLPPGAPFPPPPASVVRWLTAAAIVDAWALLAVGVAGLTDAYRRQADELAAARDAAVQGAAERVRALEALGARVAHELKNPAAAVRGLVELEREQTEVERSRRRLDVVASEVERIERTLDEYLRLARPFDGVSRVTTDAAELLRSTAASVEGVASKRGVSLSVEGGAATADLDPARVREAVMNLLLNAVEATPPGGSVRLRWEVEGDRALRIVVEDDGEGMSPETLARIHRGGFSTRARGSGMGVARARAVAEAHGGRLSYESSPGRGTRAMVSVERHGDGAGL